MHATVWMRLNFENIIQSERSQTQNIHIRQFHLYEISQGGKSIEEVNILVIIRGWW